MVWWNSISLAQPALQERLLRDEIQNINWITMSYCKLMKKQSAGACSHLQPEDLRNPNEQMRAATHAERGNMYLFHVRFVFEISQVSSCMEKESFPLCA